jgi:hypothetical protein
MKANKNKDITQRWINIIVIILLAISCIWGLIYRNNNLKKSDITVCKIISFGLSHGRGARPEVVYYEYYVNGVLFNDHSFFPHDDSVKIGNCYRLRYSIIKPQIAEILFEEGAIDCDKNYAPN